MPRYFDAEPGTAVQYMSSARGWIAAVFLGPAEDGDDTRCMVHITGHQDAAKVTRWSVRLPPPDAAAASRADGSSGQTPEPS